MRFPNFNKIFVIRIVFNQENKYLLVDHIGNVIGNLCYSGDFMSDCSLHADIVYRIRNESSGTWICFKNWGDKQVSVAEIRMSLGGIMEVKLKRPYRRYFLKRIGTFNTRFSFIVKSNEELIGVKPIIDSQNGKQELVIQINNDYAKECTPFLVLLSAHCSLVYLEMLKGALPAIINI